MATRQHLAWGEGSETPFPPIPRAQPRGMDYPADPFLKMSHGENKKKVSSE